MDILFKAHLESTLLALKQEAEVWAEIAFAIRTEGKQEIAAGVASMVQIVTRDIQAFDYKLVHADLKFVEPALALLAA